MLRLILPGIAGLTVAIVLAIAAIVLPVVLDDCPAAAPPGPICEQSPATGGFRYRLTEVFGPSVGGWIGSIEYRAGYLNGIDGVRDGMAASLEPFDILIAKNGFALSDVVIPGHFSHVIVHIGSAAELSRIGLWNDPALDEHRGDIQRGRMFIEATPEGAHLSTLEDILNTDAIAVLRISPPAAGTGEWQARTLARLMASIGQPYDFNFDVDSGAETTCAELVLRAFEGIEWPLRNVMDRRVLLPDDIIRVALSRQQPIRFTGTFAVGTDDSFAMADEERLQASLPSCPPDVVNLMR